MRLLPQRHARIGDSDIHLLSERLRDVLHALVNLGGRLDVAFERLDTDAVCRGKLGSEG